MGKKPVAPLLDSHLNPRNLEKKKIKNFSWNKCLQDEGQV
jgi:hypothetical protein